MKIVFFSTHNFERELIEKTFTSQHEITLLVPQLDSTTVDLARDHDAICVFVNDNCNADVLERLHELGVKYVLTRSAGYNHIDMKKCQELSMRVANVPEYSPYAVAEHATALILGLNRKLIRAHKRVEELNFSLDGLTGFDLNGKTVGIVGLGKIGAIMTKIMHGFGCNVLGFDVEQNEELISKYSLEYVSVEALFRRSDIITLHCPLNEKTKYIVNKESLNTMKDGVMIINTSRGALVNTTDVINGLKSRKIGYLGLDVYEEEGDLFFEDHSEDIVQDDKITRLLTFPNVLITSHQAFLTHNALKNIVETTLGNAQCFEHGKDCKNQL